MQASSWYHGAVTPIQSISYGTPVNYNVQNSPTSCVQSDTWGTTWADDGNIYTISDDSIDGWGCATTSSNLMVSTLSGFTTSLLGSSVNYMTSFGTATQSGSDGANYKALATISVSGCLYTTVSRTVYPSSPTWKQTYQNSQIIKSCDHGITWTPQPPSTAQPYVSPMFPGSNFGAPMFIQYGQDYQGNSIDNSGNYVYAFSPNGIAYNADCSYLGRVSISNIGALSAANWGWWTGGDGMLDTNWSSTLSNAVCVISNAGKLSAGAPIYIPYRNQYLVTYSYYPSINNGTPSNDTTTTVWLTYTASKPWGPYTLIQTDTWNPLGFYTPTVMPKSLSVNAGRTATLLTAGNYMDQCPTTCDYTMWIIPITIN